MKNMTKKEAFHFLDHDKDGIIGIDDIKWLYNILDEPFTSQIKDYILSSKKIDWITFNHFDDADWEHRITIQI